MVLIIKRRGLYNFTRHFVYWALFVLFFSVVWGTYDSDYFRNFMIQIYSLPSRLILVYIALYGLFKHFFLKKQYLKFAVSYLVVLIGASILVQRPIMLYYVQPTYLPEWDSSNFFVITEIMNTILDVNIAAIIPLGAAIFKIYNKTHQKTIALEQHNLDTRLKKEEEFVYLKIEKTFQKVATKNIIYIESLRNYVRVKTTEKEIIAYKSISSLENTLPKTKFLRVHRSYIVGLDFIESFSPTKITLTKITIPIGRKYKETVKKELGFF